MMDYRDKRKITEIPCIDRLWWLIRAPHINHSKNLVLIGIRNLRPINLRKSELAQPGPISAFAAKIAIVFDMPLRGGSGLTRHSWVLRPDCRVSRAVHSPEFVASTRLHAPVGWFRQKSGTSDRIQHLQFYSDSG